MSAPMTSDEDLVRCNETELHQIARRQGFPPLRRSLPKSELLSIVTGNRDVTEQDIAGTSNSRALLEEFIVNNWGVVRSQLPGCNGRCTSYPCSEGRHAMCMLPNTDLVRSGLRGGS